MFHAPIRKIFYTSSVVSILAVELVVWLFKLPEIRYAYIAILPLIIAGLRDIFQTRHAILRNYPLVGRGRYWMEAVRPEINQYFVESNIDGRPFDRETRSNIYQRAKKVLNAHPFGTQRNVYQEGYEWINHSLLPCDIEKGAERVLIGAEQCKQPYQASIFNISAMSYGSLSKNAIESLSTGAKMGGFAHNTGEGGISPYHLKGGGDLIWQIGTGYFGCRNKDGTFNEETFTRRAMLDNVRMIEIKLSQGAKPGHGGILPKEKITPEIAEIRDVPMGEDVLSPPNHSAFSTPIELLEFVERLRELSGGKPVGFKLCVGNPHEFLAICKAMLETGKRPDFITVDGSEGGTGAAPIEFSDSIGMPLNDGLVFVHNALVGTNLRDKIKIICSGKVTSAFNLISKIAMGADMCNSARGMMFALGCIQALQCHSNACPTGVATQDPYLVNGLVVGHKSPRVANYHHATIEHFLEILSAAGICHPSRLRPGQIYRRVSTTEIKTLHEVFEYIAPGCLVEGNVPYSFKEPWEAAQASSFDYCYACPV